MVMYANLPDLTVYPNPIQTNLGKGDFEMNVALPPGKAFNRFDSLDFVVLSEDTRIATMKFFPKKHDVRKTWRYTQIITIEEPLADGSYVYLQMNFYKRGRFKQSPKLQIGQTEEIEGGPR